MLPNLSRSNDQNSFVAFSRTKKRRRSPFISSSFLKDTFFAFFLFPNVSTFPRFAKLSASERACARVAPTVRHLQVHRWPIAGWSALPLGAMFPKRWIKRTNFLNKKTRKPCWSASPCFVSLSPALTAPRLLEFAAVGRLHGREQRGPQRLQPSDGTSFDARRADL